MTTTHPFASDSGLNLDHLEALARAATPGPWSWWTSNSTLRLTGADGRDGGVLYGYARQGDGDVNCAPNDQAFIAAANPAALLALIALARCAQPYATGGDVPGELHLAGEGLRPLCGQPESEATQAAPLSEVQIDRIARAYFSEQWAVQHAKDAIHDAFQDARKSASLWPLCGAQHAKSGKETAQLSIGFANNDQGVHVSVMQQHAGGAVTLLHQAKVPAGDSFARFAIAAQQATAPGALYSYMGESGRYELLGHAVGAGKCKLVEPLAIYRDTSTGNLYFRAPADFAERMVAIEANIPEFGGIKTSAPGTAKAPQTAAARDVLAERQRQVKVEGWTPARDDEHADGQMAGAAACYAVRDITHWARSEITKTLWPWASEWWKPRTKRENLIRAGALVLAEIERLDRAAAPKDGA
ncbi:hypothetical protein IFT68_00785 [Oxalobacteraceae sp. CFBP 13730]|nr:hypothetical protein [Oxalobacteraceae sp. CFBP 13730]